MREMQISQVSAVGSQRESIWKEESWPIKSEVIRRGIIQETVKPKIAANNLNNKITQGCANCQEAGLRGFLIRMNRFLQKFQLTARVSIVLFKADSHKARFECCVPGI